MLDQIQQNIERIKWLGANYVDARWYPYEESNYLMMWNGNLKSAASARESGMGIRVLYKGAWGFSASSDLSDLPALFDQGLRQCPRGRRTGHLPDPPGREGCHPGQISRAPAASTPSRSRWQTRWLS